MKIGRDNCSRGYCGWYKKNYLRSKLEFVVAYLLYENGIDFDTESNIYNIDGIRYKPDFFIYKNGILKTIIEVKYTKNDKDLYIKNFYEYFKFNNIRYIVLYKKHINKLIKKYCLDDVVDEWIINSSIIIHDMKGEKNPHYGFKHTEESKKKIGRKTIERFNNVEFKEMFKRSVKESITPEIRKSISSRMKKFMTPEIRMKMSKERTIYKKKEVFINCKECGKEVKLLKRDDGKYISQVSGGHNIRKGDVCSTRCAIIFRNRENREKKKIEQIKAFRNYYDIHNSYPNRKQFKLFCIENNIKHDIRGTFGTFKKLIGELNG